MAFHGDGDCRGAVHRAQLLENVRDMRLDGSLHNSNPGGDFLVAESPGDQPQHFQFAIGQLRLDAFREAAGNFGGNVLFSGVNGADGFQQFLQGHVLDHIAGRASLDGAGYVVAGPIIAEDQDAHAAEFVAKRFDNFDSIHPRQPQVNHHHFRAVQAKGFHGLLAILDFTDDLHVGFHCRRGNQSHPH